MTLKTFLSEGFSCTEYSLLTAGAFLAAAPNSATLHHTQKNRRILQKPAKTFKTYKSPNSSHTRNKCCKAHRWERFLPLLPHAWSMGGTSLWYTAHAVRSHRGGDSHGKCCGSIRLNFLGFLFFCFVLFSPPPVYYFNS